MHEVRRRPLRCCVLAQLVSRYMAFMHELSLNACLRKSLRLYVRAAPACLCLAAGVMTCVWVNTHALGMHERCCVRAVCRYISLLACMHEGLSLAAYIMGLCICIDEKRSR